MTEGYCQWKEEGNIQHIENIVKQFFFPNLLNLMSWFVKCTFFISSITFCNIG